MLVIFGGVTYYALNKEKDVKGSQAANNEQVQNDPATQEENAADVFGPNETKLTDDTIANFISSNKLVLVDFYLSTCPHCQKAAPILTDFSNVYKDKVKVGKIEAQQNPKVADTYQIDSVPQFFLFKDGQKVDSLSGSNVTVEDFKAIVDKALK